MYLAAAASLVSSLFSIYDDIYFYSSPIIVCVNNPRNKSMSLSFPELAVTDLSSIKKRIMLSTSFKDVSMTPLHAKIPLMILRRGVWANLCLDLVSFVEETWKGQSFRSLESIAISAVCKVKRLFTMKAPPIDTSGDDQLYGIGDGDSEPATFIPRHLQLPPDVTSVTQTVNISKVRAASSTGTSPDGPSSANLNTSLTESFSASNLNSVLEAHGRRKSHVGRRAGGGHVSAKDMQKTKPETAKDEEKRKLSTKEIQFESISPARSASIEQASNRSTTKMIKDGAVDVLDAAKSRDGRPTKQDKTSKIPRLVEKPSPTTSTGASARTRSASKERKHSAAGTKIDAQVTSLKKVGSEPNFKGLQLHGQTIESPRFRLSQSETSDKFRLAQSSDSKLASSTDNNNLFVFSCPPKQRHPSPCWTESSTRPASVEEEKIARVKRDSFSCQRGASSSSAPEVEDDDVTPFSSAVGRRGSVAKPEDDFRFEGADGDKENAESRTASSGSSRDAHFPAPFPPRVRRRTGGHSGTRAEKKRGDRSRGNSGNRGGDSRESRGGGVTSQPPRPSRSPSHVAASDSASTADRPSRGTVRLSPTTRNLLQKPQFSRFQYQSSDSDEETRKREEEYEEAKNYEEILKRSLEDDEREARVKMEDREWLTTDSLAEKLKESKERTMADGNDLVAHVPNTDFSKWEKQSFLEAVSNSQ